METVYIDDHVQEAKIRTIETKMVIEEKKHEHFDRDGKTEEYISMSD